MNVSCKFGFTFQHYDLQSIVGLKLFSIHSLKHQVSIWDCKLTSTGSLDVDLPLKSVLFEDSPIYVWIYALRHLSNAGLPTDDKKDRPYIVRIGTGCVRLSSKRDTKKEYSIIDAGISAVVGTISLQLPVSFKAEFVALPKDVDHMVHLDPYPKANGCEYLIESTRKQLRAIHDELPKSNIPWNHLDRFLFLEVQQACGAVPMWSFPVLHLRDGSDRAYLQNSLWNARHLSIYSPSTAVEKAEILNEMQTMAVRNQLYVMDSSRRCCGEDILVDDWTNPLQYDQAAELGALDCEDAALRMMQEARMLRQLKPDGKNELLDELVELEQKYITFLAGMTLYLPPAKKWVYHAACIKLDREYVLQQLQLSPSTTLKGEKFVPAILEEGTAYTTGCWTYKTEKKQQKLLDNSQFRFPQMESSAKVPVEVTKSQGIYGHVQSLFSPELFHSHSIPQIELSFQGALAAPVSELLSYSAQVRFHLVRIKPEKKAVATLEELRSMLPVNDLPRMTKETTKFPNVSSTDMGFACCFRTADWSEDILIKLAAASKIHPADVHVCTVRVDDNLTFKYVVGAHGHTRMKGFYSKNPQVNV